MENKNKELKKAGKKFFKAISKAAVLGGGILSIANPIPIYGNELTQDSSIGKGGGGCAIEQEMKTVKDYLVGHEGEYINFNIYDTRYQMTLFEHYLNGKLTNSIIFHEVKYFPEGGFSDVTFYGDEDSKFNQGDKFVFSKKKGKIENKLSYFFGEDSKLLEKAETSKNDLGSHTFTNEAEKKKISNLESKLSKMIHTCYTYLKETGKIE